MRTERARHFHTRKKSLFFRPICLLALLEYDEAIYMWRARIIKDNYNGLADEIDETATLSLSEQQKNFDDSRAIQWNQQLSKRHQQSEESERRGQIIQVEKRFQDARQWMPLLLCYEKYWNINKKTNRNILSKQQHNSDFDHMKTIVSTAVMSHQLAARLTLFTQLLASQFVVLNSIKTETTRRVLCPQQSLARIELLSGQG